jgi:hypothetical protein
MVMICKNLSLDPQDLYAGFGWSIVNFDDKLVLRALDSIGLPDAKRIYEMIGDGRKLSDEAILHQVREILTGTAPYVKQTNIPGMDWMKLTAYLLQSGYDLFGFIESGYAVEAK